MSLVINNNLMANNAARHLTQIYGRLSTSTERLSSGLRINSAADDAAGLAIRELMRADIAVMKQGIRNASDGISMIQTAEGALSVIDEKLTRMKELAEQASTGTYTTVQREIMNSEYQAMAAEIDRIAQATKFNGTKMLDGSLSSFHEGSGMKIHFGTGNSAAEDYYFVTIGDVRATSDTGLQIGGDATGIYQSALADIWTQNASAAAASAGAVINQSATGATHFGYFYDYLGGNVCDTSGAGSPVGPGNCHAGAGSAPSEGCPSYLAGIYGIASGSSAAGNTLESLVGAINDGVASRIQMNVASATTVADLGLDNSAESYTVTVAGQSIVFYNSAGSNLGRSAGAFAAIDVATATGTVAANIANAFNSRASADVWAIQGAGATSGQVFFFAKDVGTSGNSLWACDAAAALNSAEITNIETNISWTNMDTWIGNETSAFFALGSDDPWAMASISALSSGVGLELTGSQLGSAFDLMATDLSALGAVTSGWGVVAISGFSQLDFDETQNAADAYTLWSGAAWTGAHIRTQSFAQEALDGLDDAIIRKDIARANLGATQNRLENTITNLGMMAENLQASESRISDVDVATEMTEFTRNNIMAQAATAMLAQANSLPQLALTLLG